MKNLKTEMNLSHFRSRSFKNNYYVQNNIIKTPNEYIEYEYECFVVQNINLNTMLIN